jgi:Mg2+ and Co2+ transporter CorA
VSPTFVITLAYQPLAWDVEAIELKPHEIQDGESGLELDPSRIAKEVVAFRKRSGRAEGSFGLDVAAVVLDSVVDSVFDALDGLRARADELEDEISQREWLVDRRRGVEDALDDHVLGLRRLVRQVRWAFMPSDEIEEFLSGPFLGFEREDAGIEFRFRDLSREADRALAAVRDVGDHIDHAADLMAGLRTDRLNKTMYVLTAVATVLLVPTLIAGIYGMNFRNMPELGWRFGYGETLLLMVVLGFGMWLGIRWFLERSLRRRPIVRQRKGGS